MNSTNQHKNSKPIVNYRIVFYLVTIVLIICIVSAFALFHNAIYYKLATELSDTTSTRPYVNVLPAQYYPDESEILIYSYDKHVHSIEDFDA